MALDIWREVKRIHSDLHSIGNEFIKLCLKVCSIALQDRRLEVHKISIFLSLHLVVLKDIIL